MLFVSVGVGAGAIVLICIALIVFITVVALFICKKYYQRGTTVAQISKQPDMERKKPNNLTSSAIKVTSSQLFVGGDEKKRKRKKIRESTNRTSPSLVIQPIQ